MATLIFLEVTLETFVLVSNFNILLLNINLIIRFIILQNVINENYLRASIVSTSLTISLLILFASVKYDDSPSLKYKKDNCSYNLSFNLKYLITWVNCMCG